MVTLRPFRGLRYNQPKSDDLASVLAPPYDVITPAERERLAQRSPYNIIHVELPTGGEDRYERAASLLAGWRRDAILLQEHAPASYVVEERFTHQGRMQRRLGLLAAALVEPWERGAVLPHEHTMPGPKLDRLRLLRACQTNVSPIFLMYDDPGRRIRTLLEGVAAQEPVALARLEPDAIPHAASETRIWPVVDPETVEALRQAFAATQAYIADGHHRYETALSYRQEQRQAHQDSPDGPWDAALVYLAAVDDAGLVILPIHRVVQQVDPALLARLPERLADLYHLDVLPADDLDGPLSRLETAGAGALLLAGLGNGLTLARPRRDLAAALPAERKASWRALDVSQVHGLVLEPLLGIGDAEMQSEQYVRFTRDPADAIDAVRRGTAQLALLLNPTRPEQVCAVARDHERMPQKSTFFYPKPLTGLALYPHDR